MNNNHPSGMSCDEMYNKLRELDGKCESLIREKIKNTKLIEQYGKVIIKLCDLIQQYYYVDYESDDISNEIHLSNLYEKTVKLLKNKKKCKPIRN